MPETMHCDQSPSARARGESGGRRTLLPPSFAPPPRNRSARRWERGSWAIAVVVGLALGGAASSAERYQDLEQIRSVALAYANAARAAPGVRVRVRAAPLDRRLRLSPCGEPLTAFLPHADQHGPQLTVGVRCEGPRPWKIFVTTRVQALREILVTAKHVTRGEILTPAHLTLIERDVLRVRNGYLTDPGAAVGQRTRYAQPPGRAVVASALEAPRSVRRGQSVVLLVDSGGIQVRAAGSALSDGAIGETIRVRNRASARVVEGTVVGRATVRVDL